MQRHSGRGAPPRGRGGGSGGGFRRCGIIGTCSTRTLVFPRAELIWVGTYIPCQLEVFCDRGEWKAILEPSSWSRLGWPMAIHGRTEEKKTSPLALFRCECRFAMQSSICYYQLSNQLGFLCAAGICSGPESHRAGTLRAEGLRGRDAKTLGHISQRVEFTLPKAAHWGQ